MNAPTLVKVLGAIIGLAGLIFILYNETYKFYIAGNYVNVKVYPYQIIGALVALIGFVTLIIGFAIPEIKKPPNDFCGNCHLFGTSKCKRKEIVITAVPCEDFTP